jgi:hypothetical protein
MSTLEKASSALRRSSVKLLSLGSGHSDLQMVISQLRDVKAAARTFASTQNATMQDMVKWSLKDENRAIQDAVCQVAELVGVWAEVQKEFGESVKEFRKHFEMIVEGQRSMDTAKTGLEAADAKVLKTKKDMKRAVKAKAADADLREIERRMEASERERERCQIDVFDHVREHEIVKMIRIKDGLIKVTQAYLDMTRKGEILFTAGKFIACQIPDCADCEIADIKYTGSGATMQAVITAKQKVAHYTNRESSEVHVLPEIAAAAAIASSSSSSSSSPPADASEQPPPYSVNPPPSNPFFDDDELSSAAASSPNASGGGASVINVGGGGGGRLYPRLEHSFQSPQAPVSLEQEQRRQQSRRRYSEQTASNRRRSSSTHNPSSSEQQQFMSRSLVEDDLEQGGVKGMDQATLN